MSGVVVVVVVVGVCNRSQMRTIKCTCLIFGMSIVLDPSRTGIFDRSKFKVTCDISPTISEWLLVLLVSEKKYYICHVFAYCFVFYCFLFYALWIHSTVFECCCWWQERQGEKRTLKIEHIILQRMQTSWRRQLRQLLSQEDVTIAVLLKAFMRLPSRSIEHCHVGSLMS